MPIAGIPVASNVSARCLVRARIGTNASGTSPPSAKNPPKMSGNDEPVPSGAWSPTTIDPTPMARNSPGKASSPPAIIAPVATRIPPTMRRMTGPVPSGHVRPLRPPHVPMSMISWMPYPTATHAANPTTFATTLRVCMPAR